MYDSGEVILRHLLVVCPSAEEHKTGVHPRHPVVKPSIFAVRVRISCSFRKFITHIRNYLRDVYYMYGITYAIDDT